MLFHFITAIFGKKFHFLSNTKYENSYTQGVLKLYNSKQQIMVGKIKISVTNLWIFLWHKKDFSLL